jgi:hypothetical protein
VVGALVLLALFWAGFVPERPDRVFRAMPANSPFVSEHLDLARVWRDRFDNPLLVRTLQGAGVRKVEEWSSDTNIVWIVRLVSGRRSLIGWSPALGPSGTPCWTGASWAGFRGPLLRAMLAVRWVPGLGRLQVTPSGTRYLDTASKRMKARGETGLKLGFFLRENILLATLGDDPDAVRALDDRVTHDAPLAPLFRDDPQPWRQTGAAPHRAWLDPGRAPVPLPIDGAIEARITAFGPRQIGLALQTGGLAPEPSGLDDRLSGRCTAADALAADAACALLMLPAATPRHLVNRLLPDLALAADTPSSGEDMALYLTTQALGGRVFGLGVPAITLLFPDPADTPGAVTQAIARVAAATRLPLRTETPEHNLGNRILINWLGGSRHIRLAREDCTAVELQPGWLTLCTSAASLDAQRRFAPEAPAAWRSMLTDALDAAGAQGLDGFLWINLARTVDELRQIFAVYRLASALGALRATPEEAAAMNTLHTVLQTVDLEGSAGLAWSRAGGRLTARLQLQAP